MSTHMTPHYLTDAQVFSLNEKHGWFEFGDAQSDVSKAFANDAVAMHERIRSASQELLALAWAVFRATNLDLVANTSMEDTVGVLLDASRAAIAKATGETP